MANELEKGIVNKELGTLVDNEFKVFKMELNLSKGKEAFSNIIRERTKSSFYMDEIFRERLLEIGVHTFKYRYEINEYNRIYNERVAEFFYKNIEKIVERIREVDELIERINLLSLVEAFIQINHWTDITYEDKVKYVEYLS